MSGPKYVKDFSFPREFGFSGSTGDRQTVRSYERAKPQRFAKGGVVKKPPIRLTRPPKATPRSRLKPTPEQVLGGSIAAGAGLYAYDKLTSKKEKREDPDVKAVLGSQFTEEERKRFGRGEQLKETEKRLGLKHGGKVKSARYHGAKFPKPKGYAMGGPVGYKKGGDLAQDKKLVKSAIRQHIRAPKPRGHGVK